MMVKRHVRSSLVGKRSMSIAGRKTSIAIEGDFWNALREIAANETVPISHVISKIDKQRQHGNLSSAIRLFVLDHYRTIAERRDE